MNPKRTLTALIFLAMLAQAADLTGEYCSEGDQQTKDMMKQIEQINKSQVGTKEMTKIFSEMSSATGCYQFQTGNKVAYSREVFGAKVTYSGSYTQKNNSVSIALDKGDANQLLAFNKKFLTKMTVDMIVFKYCYEMVNNYETVRWKFKGAKKYPQTQQGFDSCVKEKYDDQEVNMIKAAINMEKPNEEEVKKALNENSGDFSIVGNSLHKMNKNCGSAIAYTKKGSKASTLTPFEKDKQFCLNDISYDKCNGKSYDPTEYKCEKNILLTKCGNGWYNPTEQYCSKDDIKDKDVLEDTRDGKKYHTVKIGSQTWMAENLNYAGEKDDIGVCEGKKPENCEKYGTLYNWNEAMKICPSGWHLPSKKEWDALVVFVGGYESAKKKLRTKTGWVEEKECKYTTEETSSRGKVTVTEHNECPTDEFGFSVLPRNGQISQWWSASRSGGKVYAEWADSWEMSDKEENKSSRYPRDSYLYVRCLQDTEESKKAALEVIKSAEERANLVKSLSKHTGEYGTWAEAKKLCASKGWRLPTIEEWKTLGESLEEEGQWWSATEKDKNNAYSWWRTYEDLEQKDTQRDVRCIMNNSAASSENSNASPTGSSAASPTGSSNASSENSPDLVSWLFNILTNGKIKWGLKIAYNASTVLYEGTNTETGHGAEAGIIANIPINTSIEISIGANGIYRKPYTKEIIDQNSPYIKNELIEYVASVPIMLKYNISSFYAQAGVQTDVPLKKEHKTTEGEEVTWEENTWRNAYDLGIALGLGWNINKNFAIDVKMVGSATEYNKEVGGYKLVQGNAGLNYFF